MPCQIQFESSSHRVVSPFNSDYNRSFKFRTFRCHPQRRRMAANEYRPFHKAEIISSVQVANGMRAPQSAGATTATVARRVGISLDGLAVIKQRILKNSQNKRHLNTRRMSNNRACEPAEFSPT